MIIDLKYHIASLVAVFLALAIGVLIGTAILGNDFLVSGQQELVEGIKKDIADLKEENKNYKAQLDELKKEESVHQQFEKEMLPVIVANRLIGKEIAIIETNDYGFNEEFINTLKIAGANVHSVTTFTDKFDLKDEKIRRQVADDLVLKDEGEINLTKNISLAIAREILDGGITPAKDYLESKRMIKVSGSYGIPVNTVIFIGGSQDKNLIKVNEIDLPMISYFMDRDIDVYGVEQNSVAFSYMKSYQKKKITTVDNIDMVSGQVALVLAMTGRHGDYGIKPTAKDLLPGVQEVGSH